MRSMIEALAASTKTKGQSEALAGLFSHLIERIETLEAKLASASIPTPSSPQRGSGVPSVKHSPEAAGLLGEFLTSIGVGTNRLQGCYIGWVGVPGRRTVALRKKGGESIAPEFWAILEKNGCTVQPFYEGRFGTIQIPNAPVPFEPPSVEAPAF